MSQDQVLFPRATIVITRCDKTAATMKVAWLYTGSEYKASNMRVSMNDTTSATVNPRVLIYIYRNKLTL